MPDLVSMIDRFRVPAGKRLKLADHDPGWDGRGRASKAERRKFAEATLAEGVAELSRAQERLYAADSWSLLLIFQAMDAAGKDSTIEHVISGVNPQGCQVYSFKHPSAEELDHNFLWRYTRALPERGRIGIFNRSYYEEVLVVRVHPELIAAQRIPDVKVDDRFWRDRYEDINALERHLTRNGTMILKFFLNVSKEEQRKRFLKRLEEPEKHWKFDAADLAARAEWDAYMRAYEDALSATSTKDAPWYVVPADHKWVTRAVVVTILVRAIGRLKLRYPKVTPEQMREIEEAKRILAAE